MSPVLITLIFAFAFPLILLIVWKVATGAKFSAFLVGGLCFFLFAAVLETIVHSLCLTGDNAIAKTLNGNPLYYTLYTAFAAGIFEETGRFFGFKLLLKNQKSAPAAVAYGIGHGGMEVILVLGITYLTMYLAMSGVKLPEAASSTLLETANAVTLPLAITAMAERVSAMIAHIGLSMIIFTVARQKGKFGRFLFAIILHALLDVPAALYQQGKIASMPLVEVIIFGVSLLILIIGSGYLRTYKTLTEFEKL